MKRLLYSMLIIALVANVSLGANRRRSSRRAEKQVERKKAHQSQPKQKEKEVAPPPPTSGKALPQPFISLEKQHQAEIDNLRG